jgi:hypothetical protein
MIAKDSSNNPRQLWKCYSQRQLYGQANRARTFDFDQDAAPHDPGKPMLSATASRVPLSAPLALSHHPRVPLSAPLALSDCHVNLRAALQSRSQAQRPCGPTSLTSTLEEPKGDNNLWQVVSRSNWAVRLSAPVHSPSNRAVRLSAPGGEGRRQYVGRTGRWQHWSRNVHWGQLSTGVAVAGLTA